MRVAVAAREYAYDSHDVRALGWNGREIRNAIQTAVALAETAALDAGVGVVTVTEAHLRAVVKMSRGFKNFQFKTQLLYSRKMNTRRLKIGAVLYVIAMLL